MNTTPPKEQQSVVPMLLTNAIILALVFAFFEGLIDYPDFDNSRGAFIMHPIPTYWLGRFAAFLWDHVNTWLGQPMIVVAGDIFRFWHPR